jgi:NAD+ synthase
MTVQENIIETLGVVPNIDAKQEVRKRVDFLKEFLLSVPSREGYVLGISGGQDSALAGALAQQAIDELRHETSKDYKFVALLLPYGKQADGDDALLAARDFIHADVVQEINIKHTVDAFEKTFSVSGDEDLLDYHKGNVKARVRMLTQYAVAGQSNLIVLGTDHAAEAVSGFFTVGGDGQADVLPLAGLNKRQGRELLKELGSPAVFYTKKPTADLLDKTVAQPDETELGITYDVLDDYLEGKKVPKEARELIENRYFKTEHKRQLPITPTDVWWKN